MDKTRALQNLLNGTVTEAEIELLKQALASGEISIGGDMNRSVVIIGSGNKVELTAEALDILKPEIPEEAVEGEPPYMGLRYFDTSDAALFFGREALSRELLARVSKEPFLAIIGASGSGKSSVARAGLIPAWKDENAGRSLVHVITPTAYPLESLAASLTRDSESVTATSTLMDDLMNDTRSLRLFIRKMLSGSGKPNVLLVVDQFEETFTLCKNPAERVVFIENLLSLADKEASAARVVLTLRADFYHHCAEYEGLRLALEKHQAYIGAMTQDELHEAIVQPAEKNGWDIQPGLVDLILEDAGTEPGALPLLSHALLETWKRRQGRTLTLQGYAEAGGVKKAIAQTAESVYARLSPSEQEIARSIFLRLTELGEEMQVTRRRVKIGELKQIKKKQETVAKVLKILTDTRLVTTEQDSAEVAHEALIREWGTLRQWLDENRENLRLHRHLTESALEWKRSGRDVAFLDHRGGRLDDVLFLLKNPIYGLTSIEQAYLSACVEMRKEEQRARERRSRLMLIVPIIVAAIFLVLGGYGLVRSFDAKKQAAIALARQLSIQAENIYSDNNSNLLMTGHLLAIQSMNLFPTGEAADYLTNNSDFALPISHITHDSRVLSVVFSPDSKYVVSGSADGTARVWEASSGKETSRMTHDDTVFSVAFSPDGRYVVSGGFDGTARVWEASSGEEISRMTHDNYVSSVAFSPNGEYVASGSVDGTARVWEASSGKEISRMAHDGFVFSVAFSPDGKYVVSGSADGTSRVWEASSGEEISRMTHDNYVSSVAFSPNGDYVVSGCFDGTARVWEVSNGEEVSRMTHDMTDDITIFSVAFSPDSMYVVSGGFDGTARVWEASSGEEISRMTHDTYVSSVAFSPNGEYVVSGSDDGTARVWEASSGKEISRMTHDITVFSVAFSPDGKYVVSGSGDGSAQVWKASNWEEVARMTYDNSVSSVAFSPDSKYVVSGSADGTARVWEASSGEETSRMTHDNTVFSVAFSPDGRYVVSGGFDGTAHVWEASSGEEISRMTHDNTVFSVAFSPNGEYVASGSVDGTARMWEASSGKEISRMAHDGFVFSVAFSPDGKYVVSGSADGTARVWEASSGEEISRMTHGSAVFSVAFGLGGRYVVSGGGDNIIRVWEASSGEEISRMTHDNTVISVAFSPDSRYVVSGSADGTARVWKTASGKEVARMFHDSFLTSVAFSPDSKYVVSGSADGTARVWDISSGKEVIRVTHNSWVSSVVFSPNGEYVVSGSDDSIARVWVYLPKDVIANACLRATRNLTRAEWQQYIGDALPYQAVCPNLPIEPEPTP